MRQGPTAASSAARGAGAAAGGPDDGSCVGGAGRPGFMTARTQLVTDLRKKGQHQQASKFNQVRRCPQAQLQYLTRQYP